MELVVSCKHILIVDDDSEVRSLIAAVLSDEGYNTSVAGNEQEAFSIIKNTY